MSEATILETLRDAESFVRGFDGAENLLAKIGDAIFEIEISTAFTEALSKKEHENNQEESRNLQMRAYAMSLPQRGDGPIEKALDKAVAKIYDDEVEAWWIYRAAKSSSHNFSVVSLDAWSRRYDRFKKMGLK